MALLFRHILFLGILFIPTYAHPCSVCFGKDTGDSQIQGVMWGMFILLGIVFSVFVGMAAFVWNVYKRSKAKLIQIH